MEADRGWCADTPNPPSNCRMNRLNRMPMRGTHADHLVQRVAARQLLDQHVVDRDAEHREDDEPDTGPRTVSRRLRPALLAIPLSLRFSLAVIGALSPAGAPPPCQPDGSTLIVGDHPTDERCRQQRPGQAMQPDGAVSRISMRPRSPLAAAAAPEPPIGASMAVSPASTVARTPSTVGGLRWPMWPIRNERPENSPSPMPERQARRRFCIWHAGAHCRSIHSAPSSSSSSDGWDRGC